MILMIMRAKAKGAARRGLLEEIQSRILFCDGSASLSLSLSLSLSVERSSFSSLPFQASLSLSLSLLSRTPFLSLNRLISESAILPTNERRSVFDRPP